MNLELLTIDAARSAVQERKTSAAALAESFYAKIQSDDPKIGAFLTLCTDRARAKAKNFLRWVACPLQSKT